MRILLTFSAWLLLSSMLPAQPPAGMVAGFLFNNGKLADEQGQFFPKPAGIYFVTDRFGNSGSACFIQGNINSYLNLGSDSRLKPTTGTISLWVKIESKNYSGKGYEFNPILLTKNSASNDFFEAYAIGLELKTDHFSMCCSDQPAQQFAINSSDTFKENCWYHLAMVYSDSVLRMYVNGEKKSEIHKNFKTRFLEGDSVMVGFTANPKNLKFYRGAVDDIFFYNRVLTDAEVYELYQQPDPSGWRRVMRWAILFAGAGLLIWICGFLLVRRMRLQFEREKEKNLLQQRMYEMETKAVKAQMNPHFIFNSMNAIQQFILENDNENANRYLVRFSRLLRSILESNNESWITIENEVEILGLYLEIESLRFSNHFSYSLEVDPQLRGSGYRIPQMLVQPFVENAIWHGLLPLEGTKKLSIIFELLDEHTIRCIVDDNGIGRDASASREKKSSRQSLGIGFSRQRLELMHREFPGSYRIEITDKKSPDGKSLGTRVGITMPFIQRQHLKSTT